MINYSDIIYVGSDKPLICRDGNIQYAKSMDLRFYNYRELDLHIDPMNNTNIIIFDIAVGWTSLEEMDLIEGFIKKSKSSTSIYPNSVFIRLVDQFSHQGSSDIYLMMKKLSIDYKIPIIRTYDVNYYDLPNQLEYIPYPYIIDDEINLCNRIPDKVLLSGASVKGIYPMRELLHNIADESKCIDVLGHPGYSGKYWSLGKIGNEYMSTLSQYNFMICTTCNESYELLKYVECAEAGCVPVGEVPISLNGTEAEDYIIQIPSTALISSNDFDGWFLEVLSSVDIESISKSYRRCIKELRDKNKIKNKLLNTINYEIYKKFE